MYEGEKQKTDPIPCKSKRISEVPTMFPGLSLSEIKNNCCFMCAIIIIITFQNEVKKMHTLKVDHQICKTGG